GVRGLGVARQGDGRYDHARRAGPVAAARVRCAMINRLPVIIALATIVITVVPAFAQLDQLLRGLPKTINPGSTGSALSDARIAEGLKQALQVGTENAVGLTGKLDGYFRNETIKILLPERLQP